MIDVTGVRRDRLCGHSQCRILCGMYSKGTHGSWRSLDRLRNGRRRRGAEQRRRLSSAPSKEWQQLLNRSEAMYDAKNSDPVNLRYFASSAVFYEHFCEKTQKCAEKEN